MKKQARQKWKRLIEKEFWRNITRLGKRDHKFLILALVLTQSNCASIPEFKQVKLPVFASAFFVDCSQINGAASVSISDNKSEKIQIDTDFAAKDNGDWGVASYTPFGQTVFQIEYKAKQKDFIVSGRQIIQAKKLSIGPNDIIEYDSYPLGLKPNELMCFSAGKLPRDWLKQIIQYEEFTHEYVITVYDRVRSIQVKIAKHSDKKLWNWQCVSKWSSYMGLRQESFELLSFYDRTLQLKVKSLEDVEIRWKEKDEEY